LNGMHSMLARQLPHRLLFSQSVKGDFFLKRCGPWCSAYFYLSMLNSLCA
jgi:hypothetical protein